MKNKKPPSKTIRQQQLALLSRLYPHYVFKANPFASLFLVGGLAIIWEIDIFRKTFIDPTIPFVLAVFTGVALTPLLRKTVNIYLYNPYNIGKVPLPFHLVFNIVSFGGMLALILMWTNLHWAYKEKQILTLPIQTKGHLARSKNGCAQPYADIQYKSAEKELIFPCETPIEKYDRVYVEIQRGLFNYDVITRQTLIQGEW
jgi:hypothetical protein